MNFKALVTERDAAGAISSSVQTLDDDRLPEGNVTVAVEWADVNYKDGLCLTGAGGLVRTYPHVAGVDFSGTVIESADPRYVAGQKVVLTGWRVGESHWGGYSEKARVNADWLVPLAEGLSTRDAMVMGTAGLTAMLAIDRLEANGLKPGDGEVLVTGAGGGVGTVAIHLLSKLGYEVAAISGRPQLSDGLKALGAKTIISREEFFAAADKPLESARWAAVVEAVGGAMLGKLLKQVRYHGAVAAIGNAGGVTFETNVLPFILRGVALLGIDSVMQPYERRVAAWARIAELFDFSAYDGFVQEITLDDLPEAAKAILAGQVRGRLVVRM
ncbi:acrylyl-CoA reductase (NADPH) [Rhizobium sp. BK313]|uniref:MDR family oxidoreductase n=1 Tax=Rhizobium sp. BK313 TaxID=2587081 RepID=UPI00105DD489|nr:MDR family oxidoreductase [Rhizobium sp. BK313]MBB3456852.1 acrylyl-CoA reductase (NADPH) [Rhizobium sp. BK313]